MAQRGNVLMANQSGMDGWTFDSGPFASALPPQNLLLREPSDALLWTDLTQTWLIGRPPAPQSAELVHLGFLGCTDAATWRVRFRLGGVTVHDSRVGMTDLVCADAALPLPSRKNRRHCFIRLASPVTFDEIEIEVFDPANPAGRLFLSSLFVAGGPTGFFQGQRNLSYGLTPPSLADPSRAATAAPGQRPPLYRSPYDIAAFQLNYLSEQEAIGDLRDFLERVGTTRPVLAILKPLAEAYSERWTIIGLLEAVEPIVLPQFNIYRTAFRFEGLIP